MEIKILSYTKEPEKTCAVSMRSTRTKESAHELWRKKWVTRCPVKTNKHEYDSCPKSNECRSRHFCAVRLLREAKKMKHWGVFEHAVFTVSVSGISRACTHQLVRHRLFSYLQSSSRIIDFGRYDSAEFVVPHTVDNQKSRQKFLENIDSAISTYKEFTHIGIPREDARYILPEATPQHIVITGNARNWLHFFYLRMSKQAQWEIRDLAREICGKLMEISPEIFRGAGKLEC